MEWDPDEQALMLALHRYRAQVGPCGHYLPHTTDAAAEDAYRGVMRRCHACTAVAIEAERYVKSPQPSAVLVGAERR